MLETFKNHPYLTGAAVLAAVGVIIIVSSSRGAVSSTVTSGVDPSTVAAGAAIAQAQLAAQAHSADTSAALMANQDNNAANLSLAQIRADQENKHDSLLYTIANNQLEQQGELGRLTSTLAYQAHETDVNAALKAKELEATTSLTNTQTLAGFLTSTQSAQLARDSDRDRLAFEMADRQAQLQFSIFQAMTDRPHY